MCWSTIRRTTESVDIPAFLPALGYPYEHGADGEDHDGQSERKQQTREQPAVPFLSREEPRQFFSYHSGVSFRGALAQLMNTAIAINWQVAAAQT
jgi:hypothetical protein